MDDGSDFAWPVERLTDAVDGLARASGLSAYPPGEPIPVPSTDTADADQLSISITRASRALGLEVDSAEVSHADVDQMLATAGPALVAIVLPSGPALLAITDASGRSARLLAPDGRRHSIAVARVAAWLRRHVELPFEAETAQLLTDAKVPSLKQPAARAALFKTRLGTWPVTRGWILRPVPAASLWQHMKHAHLPKRLGVFLLSYAAAALVSMGAWWLIGGAALEGRLESGTLVGWSFLLLGLVPLAVFAMWSQGLLAIGVGGILKTQLLAGALKLDPDDTRHQGIGQHLARVLESEAVEALAMTGGFYALAAGFDLLLALFVLTTTSGVLQAALLVLTAAGLVGIGVAYFRRREHWTAARLGLTHDLVERMVGHRTRLVQEAESDSHIGEDEALEHYVRLSKRMDNAAVVLSAIPRLWLVGGLAMLAPAFVLGGATAGVLTVQLGVILLAFTALSKMTTGLTALADAAIGARQVTPLLKALRKPELAGHLDATADRATPDDPAAETPLISARGVVYAFKERAEPVLRACSFSIDRGDRIQLTGPSGGGKSTLVSLLTGLRQPESGLLLLDGLDQATMGSRMWRQRVTAAPQFHENHLFNDTLAFNLLIGCAWPPTVESLRRADAVCRRLGLGDLLDRMPGGLFTVVGEGGWQLSHGERSRVYMARALLQDADLVIFDESFAELDPDSLQRYLPEAAAMSKSLLMITHG